MTTSTINGIRSAINEYLAEERKARAELIAELYEAHRKAQDEFFDFMDVMDAQELMEATDANDTLAGFIHVLDMGIPLSESKAMGFIDTMRGYANDSYEPVDDAI